MSEPEHILQAKKLAAGPLGEQLGKFPLLFAKSILFGERPSEAKPATISSGSVSLVNLGRGPIAVTCEHVIAGYREMLATHSNVLFQIGEVEIDPIKQLIDLDARLDLATIHLTDTQTQAITSSGPIGSCIFEPKPWPPEPVKAGQFVAFGGFPGSLRTIQSFDEIVFASWSSGASEVSSVSDGQFVAKFDREAWVRSFGADHHLTLTDLGGLSGCPAFINRGLYWDFVGVVSSYHSGYDAMFFSAASRLHPDGTIEPLPV
jgi:hypothetical protein